MQIIIFSLLILALIIFLIYKIKKSFSKNELIGFVIFIILIVIASSYLNNKNKHKLPNSFKKVYLKDRNIEIKKISYVQTNVQVLNSTKEIYDFVYIIEKEHKEYVCEAKDVEVQLIEDEYVFKPYNEDCRIK